VGSKSGCATGKRGPNCGNALGFMELAGELFLRAIVFPSAAALELAYIGKPLPGQGMPFLDDPIETNFALNAPRHSPIRCSTDTQCIDDNRKLQENNGISWKTLYSDS
jgi:hypothetical protein